VVLATCACGAPADDAAYREAASRSVADAQSSAATAELAVRQWLEGRLTSAAATVVVDDADSSMGGADEALRAIDPPGPASDSARERTVPVVDRAREAVATARIALSRNDKAAATKAVGEIGDLLDQLDDVAVRLR
jgi:hypothetical protein